MSTSSESLTRIVVNASEEGLRVDRFISLKTEGVGRNLAGKLCNSGQVRVNGRRVRKSYCVEEGALVQFSALPFGNAVPAPDIELSIVFSCSDLVIVDKAAGVPTAALPGKEIATMAGALLAHFPEMADVGFGRREPGIVHRLDTHTSGLLLAARNQDAFRALRAALKGSRIDKRYLALVHSNTLPDTGFVEVPLTNDLQNRRRVRAAREGEGYACRTEFKILRRQALFDLVEARAPAAFRHQIRHHLASLGAPLVGDVLYGGCSTLKSRHALHASYLKGCSTGFSSFQAESCLPPDLQSILERHP